MNKNKKITALAAVALLTTSLVGCSSNLSKEDAHKEFDEFMESTENVSVAFVEGTFDVMASTELNIGDFDSKDLEAEIEDYVEECEDLKIKELREYSKVLADVLEEVCDKFEDYSEGKIDADELQENVNKINTNHDAKAYRKIEKVAKRYKYDLDAALEDLENATEKAVTEATASLLSTGLGSALESLSDSLSEYSDKKSDLDDIEISHNEDSDFDEDEKEDKKEDKKESSNSYSSKGYDEAFDEIMVDAKKEDIFDYNKGENAILDDLVNAMETLYADEMDSVELKLYKKGRINSDMTYEIEPLTSEDKKKLDDTMDEIEEEFFAKGIRGIDKSKMSVFYYDSDNFDVDEQVRVSFAFDIVGKDGKGKSIIGKPLNSFYIIKDNGEIKIVADSIF